MDALVSIIDFIDAASGGLKAAFLLFEMLLLGGFAICLHTIVYRVKHGIGSEILVPFGSVGALVVMIHAIALIAAYYTWRGYVIQPVSVLGKPEHGRSLSWVIYGLGWYVFYTLYCFWCIAKHKLHSRES
jgi:hypothetical protein